MLYATEMVPEPREAKNEGLAMIFGFFFFYNFSFFYFLVFGSEQMVNCQLPVFEDFHAPPCARYALYPLIAPRLQKSII